MFQNACLATFQNSNIGFQGADIGLQYPDIGPQIATPAIKPRHMGWIPAEERFKIWGLWQWRPFGSDIGRHSGENVSQPLDVLHTVPGYRRAKGRRSPLRFSRSCEHLIPHPSNGRRGGTVITPPPERARGGAGAAGGSRK